eukprot:COSAG01_NODE_4865_length_4672_cov_6.338071_4_plen_86_part_00
MHVRAWLPTADPTAVIYSTVSYRIRVQPPSRIQPNRIPQPYRYDLLCMTRRAAGRGCILLHVHVRTRAYDSRDPYRGTVCVQEGP